MLNMDKITVLSMSDENIQRWYNETPLEGSRVESLWKRLIDKEDLDPAVDHLQAQTVINFQDMLSYILEQMKKTDKDIHFYYRGDFIQDIWIWIQPWVNMRSERPVKLTLSFELDQNRVCPDQDPDAARAYVEGILTLLTQVPAFDLEIFQGQVDKDYLMLAYEDLFCGVAKRGDDQNRSIYFSNNPTMIQYAFDDLKAQFAFRRPLMCTYPDFKDHLDILDHARDPEDRSPAYVYLPFIYLYMGSLDLRQDMYEDGYIDKAEYDNWGFFHQFLTRDRVLKARFILNSTAMQDAFDRGVVKTQGGLMPLGDYRQAFIRDTKHYRDPDTWLNIMAVEDPPASQALPSVMIFADLNETLIIRTSLFRGFDPTRITSIVTGKPLARAFYTYLDTIYTRHQQA